MHEEETQICRTICISFLKKVMATSGYDAGFSNSRIGMIVCSLGKWICIGKRNVLLRRRRWERTCNTGYPRPTLRDSRLEHFLAWNLVLYATPWSRYFCGIPLQNFPGSDASFRVEPSFSRRDFQPALWTHRETNRVSRELWLFSVCRRRMRLWWRCRLVHTFGSLNSCFALLMVAESASSSFSHTKF